jgi:hypothetical protein
MIALSRIAELAQARDNIFCLTITRLFTLKFILEGNEIYFCGDCGAWFDVGGGGEFYGDGWEWGFRV